LPRSRKKKDQYSTAQEIIDVKPEELISSNWRHMLFVHYSKEETIFFQITVKASILDERRPT